LFLIPYWRISKKHAVYPARDRRNCDTGYQKLIVHLWYSIYVNIIFPGSRHTSKKEFAMERNESVVILDAGNEDQPIIGPEASFCCAGVFSFFRR
jgi:hypothetical protein